MNPLPQTKAQMRATVLARRDELPFDVRKRKSDLICRQLEHLVADMVETRSAGGVGTHPHLCIAVYAAMRSEVDLQPFVEAMYEQGHDVCFPCMVREQPKDSSQMAFYRIPREQLEQAREAFLDSPLRCLACTSLAEAGYQRVAPDELDAVAVPLVAFDDKGGRLGYGGGNYDRLLPLLRNDTLVAGIAFAEQRVDAVPVEPHDHPLPHLLSA